MYGIDAETKEKIQNLKNRMYDLLDSADMLDRSSRRASWTSNYSKGITYIDDVKIAVEAARMRTEARRLKHEIDDLIKKTGK